MKQNRLKIHIETGNIWYDGSDTGESIFTFLKMQQNDDMIFIENHFLYNDSYKNYFGNYINNIDGEINSKLDFFTNRNARYLLYRFIDLLTNAGIDLVRVRHSQKVKDNIAIAQIQKTDWQYFINRLLDIIWSNEIGDRI